MDKFSPGLAIFILLQESQQGDWLIGTLTAQRSRNETELTVRVCERRNKFKQMKRKLCILTLLGLAAGSLVAFAQDNPPPADQQPAASPARANAAPADQPATA